MKSIVNNFVALVFALVAFTVFTTVAAAQGSVCVNCSVDSGGCFRCRAAPSGGCTCSFVTCASCQIDEPCAAGHSCLLNRPQSAGIKVDEATILQIAQIHPRFAAALAVVNKAGGLRNWSKIYFLPARLEASEVANWLKPPAAVEGFFSAYKERVVPKAKSIAVEFNLTHVNATQSTIRGNIVQRFSDDPPETQLEIMLNDGQVTSWQVQNLSVRNTSTASKTKKSK